VPPIDLVNLVNLPPLVALSVEVIVFTSSSSLFFGIESSFSSETLSSAAVSRSPDKVPPIDLVNLVNLPPSAALSLVTPVFGSSSLFSEVESFFSSETLPSAALSDGFVG